jgi:hypothetical protein
MNNGYHTFYHNLSKGLYRTLLVFWSCGLFGLLIDADHFIRCLPHPTFECAIDHGAKLFHTWIGFAGFILYGVGGSLLLGYIHRLVDNAFGRTTDYY